jgi:hypothetical protein
LCVFLLLFLISGSSIASAEENTQGESICDNKHAMNSELCGETISTSTFFQRCVEDPRFCSPGDLGKIPEVSKDTTEQSRTASDAGIEVTQEEDLTESDVATEDTYVACEDPTLVRDEILTVLGPLYQEASFTTVWEFEGTMDDVMWDTFWGTFLGAFLGGLLGGLDDETLMSLDEILSSEELWAMFDEIDEEAAAEILEPWEDYVTPMVENDAFWVAFEEAFGVAFEEAYLEARPESSAFWETFEETEMDIALTDDTQNITDEAIDDLSYVAYNAAYEAAYDAGMEVAQEANWMVADVAVRDVFKAAYDACGDPDIALGVTLQLLDIVYQEGICIVGFSNTIEMATE